MSAQGEVTAAGGSCQRGPAGGGSGSCAAPIPTSWPIRHDWGPRRWVGNARYSEGRCKRESKCLHAPQSTAKENRCARVPRHSRGGVVEGGGVRQKHHPLGKQAVHNRQCEYVFSPTGKRVSMVGGASVQGCAGEVCGGVGQTTGGRGQRRVRDCGVVLGRRGALLCHGTEAVDARECSSSKKWSPGGRFIPLGYPGIRSAADHLTETVDDIASFTQILSISMSQPSAIED